MSCLILHTINNNNNKGMAFGHIITLCVESNIYNHLFYQIVLSRR